MAEEKKNALAVVILKNPNVEHPYHAVIRSKGNHETIFWTENYERWETAVEAGRILFSNGLRADFLNETGEDHKAGS